VLECKEKRRRSKNGDKKLPKTEEEKT